jgi:hypothetical protein
MISFVNRGVGLLAKPAADVSGLGSMMDRRVGAAP